MVAAAAGIGITGASAPAQPAEQPRWYLDGAGDRCVLTRRLAGTPGPAAFVLRTVPGSGTYDVMLAVPDLDRSVQRVKLSVAPEVRTHEQQATIVTLPRGLGEALAIPYLPKSFRSEFAGATHIQLADEKGRTLGRWTIPAAARAASTLAECETEKQIEWGADPAGLGQGASPPRMLGDAEDWLSARDVGLDNMSSRAAIAAVFRLAVGPDGRVSDCLVLESAGSVELDRGACKTLVRRARFQPASNATGTPVQSIAIYRFASQMNGFARGSKKVPLSVKGR